MKCLALFVYFLCLTGKTLSTKICLSDSDVDTLWKEYKEMFGKKYRKSEDVKRKSIWEQNIADQIQHNLLADLGKAKFKRGMNEYSDLQSVEYKTNLLGYVKPPNAKRKGRPFTAPKKFQVPVTVGVNVEDGNNYIFPIATPTPQGKHKKASKKVLGASEDAGQSVNGQIPSQILLTSNAKLDFFYNASYLEYLPDNLDWRDYGIVTPVKNQGNCGSCWSFSAAGSLEGQLAISTGVLTNLSEQYLVDCVTDNSGCEGGGLDSVFQYVITNGIAQESDYPYTGTQGQCNANSSTNYAHNEGYYDIPYADETLLMAAVATRGPISVAIDAGLTSFQTYSYGIYHDPNCDTQNINHAVLLVGYGTESGSDYWLVKNSWGTSWGDQGYFKMARNSNNTCGIATAASFPYTVDLT